MIELLISCIAYVEAVSPKKIKINWKILKKIILVLHESDVLLKKIKNCELKLKKN